MQRAQPLRHSKGFIGFGQKRLNSWLNMGDALTKSEKKWWSQEYAQSGLWSFLYVSYRQSLDLGIINGHDIQQVKKVYRRNGDTPFNHYSVL